MGHVTEDLSTRMALHPREGSSAGALPPVDPPFPQCLDGMPRTDSPGLLYQQADEETMLRVTQEVGELRAKTRS